MKTEKNTYYLTFGQKYPFRDGWVEVEADSYDKAREVVESVFEDKWSFLYSEEDFRRTFFPDGKLGRTMK